MATTQIYHKYKSGARRRQIEFNLDEGQVMFLIFDNCYYCDCPPSNTLIRKRKSSLDLVVKYNGIDRIDNNRGYEKDNCITCCFLCNAMKKAMSFEDFTSHIVKIYKTLHDEYWKTP